MISSTRETPAEDRSSANRRRPSSALDVTFVVTGGALTISAGTMYGTLSKMEADGLIAFVREEEKRKLYQITPLGEEILDLELERIERLYQNSRGEIYHG